LYLSTGRNQRPKTIAAEEPVIYGEICSRTLGNKLSGK